MTRASQAASVAAIQAVLPAAGTFYLDLSNTDPGTTGATGLATTRQAFTPSSGTAAVPSVVSNTNAITVPTAGTTAANYVMIYTAATGGSYVIGAPLSSPVTAASVTFAVGQASFTAS
jgi:hypothetical protein